MAGVAFDTQLFRLLPRARVHSKLDVHIKGAALRDTESYRERQPAELKGKGRPDGKGL